MSRAALATRSATGDTLALTLGAVLSRDTTSRLKTSVASTGATDGCNGLAPLQGRLLGTRWFADWQTRVRAHLPGGAADEGLHEMQRVLDASDVEADLEQEGGSTRNDLWVASLAPQLAYELVADGSSIEPVPIATARCTSLPLRACTLLQMADLDRSVVGTTELTMDTFERVDYEPCHGATVGRRSLLDDGAGAHITSPVVVTNPVDIEEALVGGLVDARHAFAPEGAVAPLVVTEEGSTPEDSYDASKRIQRGKIVRAARHVFGGLSAERRWGIVAQCFPLQQGVRTWHDCGIAAGWFAAAMVTAAELPPIGGVAGGGAPESDPKGIADANHVLSRLAQLVPVWE